MLQNNLEMKSQKKLENTFELNSKKSSTHWYVKDAAEIILTGHFAALNVYIKMEKRFQKSNYVIFYSRKTQERTNEM